MKRMARKSSTGKQNYQRLIEGNIDVKVELIQSLIPLGLMYVEEVLQLSVAALAGSKYAREQGPKRHVRWGKQNGYVYLADQRVGIDVPRIKDREAGNTAFPEIYHALQKPRQGDAMVLSRLLHGLKCRHYEESAALVPEALGLSASNVSRRFIKASARKLAEFCERPLNDYDIVTIFIDGKTFADDQMVIALGIEMSGEKVLLGFVESATENARVCREFLENLLTRGLKMDEGLLCVIDGSKGLYKAIKDVFGDKALVQRCQWHKRENVVSYLPKGKQALFRRKLQFSYEKPTYKEAKNSLEQVSKELNLINESAANSLAEGLAETLTLHRLGLFKELGRSFKTTNCLESLNSLVERTTRKVCRWTNSNQKQRWLATALLDIEPRLRKVNGYKHLALLRMALKRELRITTKIEERLAA